MANTNYGGKNTKKPGTNVKSGKSTQNKINTQSNKGAGNKKNTQRTESGQNTGSTQGTKYRQNTGSAQSTKYRQNGRGTQNTKYAQRNREIHLIEGVQNTKNAQNHSEMQNVKGTQNNRGTQNVKGAQNNSGTQNAKRVQNNTGLQTTKSMQNMNAVGNQNPSKKKNVRQNCTKQNSNNIGIKKIKNAKVKGKKNKPISKKRRIIRRILLGIMLIIMSVMMVFILKYGPKYMEYQKEAEKIVKEGGIQAFKQNQTSTIYDKNGSIITELSGSHDAYYIEDANIPKYVKAAFVTTEDRRFYSHAGVDMKAIVRAFVEYVRNKGVITQGGSTITQQLARNVFLSHEVSMDRKLKEMFIAKEIERKYSKKQILEFYINNIYFGNGFYGVEAAAKGYFNKSVTELSLAQIAYICSIPNNPTLYNPFTNNENTLKRKDRILKQMYEQGDIGKSEYDEAIAEKVLLNPQESEGSNYVETYAIYCATQALMKESGFQFRYYFLTEGEEEDYNEEYEELYNRISGNLYTGGYKIYTSIDMDMQKTLQSSLDEQLEDYDELDDNGIYTFQGSATCIDNETGKVVAIVGGRSQNYSGYTLNRAFQSYRQPGSTIKPILVYTPAFEKDRLPRTIVEDEPIEDGPVNSPDVYDGDITIRYAVEKSKNTVAWNLFEKLGIDECISYLKQMNFHKIVPDDYVLPMSIGGMTYGVSTLEMASAYATLENDGVFRSPTCIERIVDVEGDTLVDNTGDAGDDKSTIEVKRVYDTNASRMMTDVLMGVLTQGTGVKYNIDDAICAAKTGTTNDNKDVWLCGYSRYYTTAVWVGYDMPREINDGIGNTCAGYIWQNYMSKIHKYLEEKEFEEFEINYDGMKYDGEGYYEEEEESEEESSDETSQTDTTSKEGEEKTKEPKETKEKETPKEESTTSAKEETTTIEEPVSSGEPDTSEPEMPQESETTEPAVETDDSSTE